MIPTPLELLQSKLKELEHSLHKSKLHVEAGYISKELHLIHKCNLIPKIFDYTLAIVKLIESEE